LLTKPPPTVANAPGGVVAFTPLLFLDGMVVVVARRAIAAVSAPLLADGGVSPRWLFMRAAQHRGCTSTCVSDAHVCGGARDADREGGLCRLAETHARVTQALFVM